MFVRLGQAFGPIVESNETTVWFEAKEPFNIDGKRIAVAKSELSPAAQREVKSWEEIFKAS